MSAPRKPATISRRRLLQSSAAAGIGLTILRRPLLGADAPSNKLNVALIGVGGRGRKHFGAVKEENVVALCDVNEEALARAAKTFPNAKHYVDWRERLVS